VRVGKKGGIDNREKFIVGSIASVTASTQEKREKKSEVMKGGRRNVTCPLNSACVRAGGW